MASIRDISNPWRDRYQQASFRGATFFVENDARQGGRRSALHEYPKRNQPYTEDMGRAANRFTVQGYLIGPEYLTAKDRLIQALEEDGPGTLRLPLPYRMRDVRVLALNYVVTESRERGGMCILEMDFMEAGTPTNRGVASTSGQIELSAATVERTAAAQPAMESVQQTVDELKQYRDIWNMVPQSTTTNLQF